MKDVIRKKNWTITFIALIIFFSLPGYFFANNISTERVLLACIVNLFAFIAFSVISLFIKGKTEKFLICILFILSLIPNLTVFTYLCISQIQMSNDMYWVIFASNPSESNAYFDEFITPAIWIGQIAYVLASVFLLYKSFRSDSSRVSLKIRNHLPIFIPALLVPILIITFQSLTNGITPIDFYKSCFRFLREDYEMRKNTTARRNIPIDISCDLSSQNNTFIVIIGESLTRTHMHVYGYDRPTTPMLDSMKDDLYIYNDVVSPNTHTIAVLKYVLTLANYDHPEYYLEKPSVVELFKKAGFKTYWISTQEMTNKWGSSYGIIARETDKVINLSSHQKYDEVVLPHIDDILKENTQENRIIFIHLMGNHNAYKSRYPSDFNYFNNENYPISDKPFLDEKMKKTIDEYDNSVRYSDYVVSSVIQKMQKKENLPSFVVFFSDHGEEIFDHRPVSGHSIANPSSYQCEVPFILWCSNTYLAEKNDLIFKQNRPFCTENFIHSLSTLAGLKYPDYDPKLSLFDKEFIPQKRMVGEESYEEVISNTNSIRNKSIINNISK